MSNTTKKKNRMLKVIVALLLVGAAGVAVPLVMQDMELRSDAAEYEALREQTKIETTAEQPADEVVETVPDELDEPDEVSASVHEHGEEAPTEPDVTPSQQAIETPAAEESAAPVSSPQRKTGADLESLMAQNSDFIAWIQIPGTNVDYPVVLTDDTEYYLHHSFSGASSKLGTLFSLTKTDYETPGRNIAVYGHNISSSSQNMFRMLHSYKDMDFYADHATIHFDTIHHSGTYTIFAVLNMIDGDWDPSTSVFMSDSAFEAFVANARDQALYDTGIEVTASDEILTLITCDRKYSDPDGRLIVMAVKQ